MEPQCIHQLFEGQAERTPDAVAVVFGRAQLTYKELNERANQLAHYLRRKQVGPDVLVALCLPCSLERVISIFAVLKAGGAYVPLDPHYPKDRLGWMLEDSGTSILLTQPEVLPRLPPAKGRTLCLDALGPELAGEEKGNPVGGASADCLAYVIYTSGSTGRPKGIMIPHRPGFRKFVRLT
jgi:non-ribosomal peptide synthetase component F